MKIQLYLNDGIPNLTITEKPLRVPSLHRTSGSIPSCSTWSWSMTKIYLQMNLSEDISLVENLLW